MEIYLIRHTKPLIEKGMCYGQSDVDVDTSFMEEARQIRSILPRNFREVYCSPLIRCRKLAAFLFPNNEITYCEDLKEINCGEWELKKWNEIPEEILNPWMNDFVGMPFPKGESYQQFHQRIINKFEELVYNYKLPVAVIVHAGVIRSILSHITKTPLEKSFDRFNIPFGYVVKLSCDEGNWIQQSLV